MLKREIKYKDFDDKECVETFYFNISRPEIVELEVEYDEGLRSWFQKVIEAKDNKTILALFKKIILLAYGEKSEDGKRFIKTDEMKEQFAQTGAYIALFTELSTDENAAANFMLGVLPSDMTEGMDAKALMSPEPAAEAPAPPAPTA